MKKIFITVILFSIIFISSCSRNIRERWVDDNTFQVAAVGGVKDEYKHKNMIIRKTMACEAARLNASAMILKRFAQTGVNNVKGTVELETAEGRAREVFRGTVKGGVVKSQSFDAKTNMCEIIFEITETGLKRKSRIFLE